jgi:hypothetical protein
MVRDQAKKIFTTEAESVADRAWNKILQQVRISNELKKIKVGPEDKAKIDRRIEGMKAALAQFDVDPSEEPPPSSDTSQGGKPPSK